MCNDDIKRLQHLWCTDDMTWVSNDEDKTIGNLNLQKPMQLNLSNPTCSGIAWCEELGKKEFSMSIGPYFSETDFKGVKFDSAGLQSVKN